MSLEEFSEYMRSRFYDVAQRDRIRQQMCKGGFRQSDREPTPEFYNRFLLALNALGEDKPSPRLQCEIFISGLRSTKLQEQYEFKDRGTGTVWEDLGAAYGAIIIAFNRNPSNYDEPARHRSPFEYRPSSDKGRDPKKRQGSGGSSLPLLFKKQKGNDGKGHQQQQKRQQPPPQQQQQQQRQTRPMSNRMRRAEG